MRSFLLSGLSSDYQHLSPSRSSPAPSQEWSAAGGRLGKLYDHPLLPFGLICFFCTCVTLFTKKNPNPKKNPVLSCLMPVSPQSWEPRQNPASWSKAHGSSPAPCSLVTELGPRTCSCWQAQFHAWANINYAWSDILGLRCSSLICHSLFLPHLARGLISVRLTEKALNGHSENLI